MTNTQATNDHIFHDSDDIELRLQVDSSNRKSNNDADSTSQWQEDSSSDEMKYGIDKKCEIDHDDNNDDDSSSPLAHHSTKLSFFDAICVLTTFATAGSIVAVPWAVSQLGYVLGPILLITVASMNLYFYSFLIDVADACPVGSCKTLGDVGHELAGKKGRYLFDAFQIGNLILYMPVALETVGLSLEYLVDGSCIGWWNIASFAGLIVMVQFMKCWTHVAWLAYITVAIAAGTQF